jgi:hypothetical protein
MASISFETVSSYAPEPNVDLLEWEPDDIHLEYTIP